jgi:hypothetical protein
VLNGKAGISAAMAIRLAAALGTTPEMWMNKQSQYDLWRGTEGAATGGAEIRECSRARLVKFLLRPLGTKAQALVESHPCKNRKNGAPAELDGAGHENHFTTSAAT